MPREARQCPQRKVTRDRQSRPIALCTVCTSMGYEPVALGTCNSVEFCEAFQLQNHLACVPLGKGWVGLTRHSICPGRSANQDSTCSISARKPVYDLVDML